MGGSRNAIATFVICSCISISIPNHAAADDAPALAASSPTAENRPTWSYLWNNGAIPFIWVPLAARLALDGMGTPRRTPWLFDPTEGGRDKATWEVPGWSVTALGGALALGMIASGDDARFDHVKGLAQSLATGVLVTATLKLAFGRHRPDWDPDVDSASSRRSFPSGHATQAFAIATYAALFLRHHVFDDLRGDRALPWWEAATYGGLLASASLIAGERVLHNRHHLTDVGVGALLGTATSTLFYLYQDRHAKDRARATEARSLSIAPTVGAGTGTGVSMSFTW